MPKAFGAGRSDPELSEAASARPVKCNGLILLMDTPAGQVGACPKSVRDQGVTLVSTWHFQEGCTFQPRCGLRPPPLTPEFAMRFYNRSHQFYCGIDLHARLLAVCVLDQAGNVVCQTKIA